MCNYYLPTVRVQRIQNLCARIISKNWDYINTRRIDFVKSSERQTVRECNNYLLCVLKINCICGLAPQDLSNDVNTVDHIHGYNTRSSENVALQVPRCSAEHCQRSFVYKGSMM